MNALDTVAAQRDAANAKVRELSIKLDAANAEIERLKLKDAQGGYVPPVPQGAPGIVHGEVPQASPLKSKRPRIFGG
jgi:hypothetical protein